MSRPDAFELDTRLGRVAGLAWRKKYAPRVLCLHGWLDNAASFTPLARHLDQLDLVAVDLPGHGYSEHRHSFARYHFIDYLFNVDCTLDALGWENCHLLGHSMGAAISSTYAAGSPERVRSIVLLDSMGPLSAGPGSTADRLQRSLAKNRRTPQPVRRYDSLDDMVAARRKVTGLSEKAARLICERAARCDDGCYTWRSDPALNWISSLIMTDEQALDLLRHIQAPAMSFSVTPGSSWFSAETVAARKQAIAHGQHFTVEGHHHFHMDEPEKVGETIQQFILNNDQAPQTARSHESP